VAVKSWVVLAALLLLGAHVAASPHRLAFDVSLER